MPRHRAPSTASRVAATASLTTAALGLSLLASAAPALAATGSPAPAATHSVLDGKTKPKPKPGVPKPATKHGKTKHGKTKHPTTKHGAGKSHHAKPTATGKKIGNLTKPASAHRIAPKTSTR